MLRALNALSSCPTSLIDWYEGAEWAIRCPQGLYVKCVETSYGIILDVAGCGERAVVPVSARGQPTELESNADWLNSVLKGEVDGFRASCSRPLRLSLVRPVSSGLRSVTYEGVDQTSGQKVLVKVMRRLEADNLEHKVLRYLTERGISGVPPYLCHVEYDDSLYAIVTGFVEGEPAASFYVQSARANDPALVSRLSERIASRLAELHRAFIECDQDWCRPEPVSEQDIERWVGRLTWRASWLRTEGSSLVAPGERTLLYEASDGLYELAARLGPTLSSMLGRVKTRTHGDLHLYQIMVAKDDVVITDFEGEPYRMPASKAEKEPIERDLAAFGRSVDYAAIMGEQARSGEPIADISSWPSQEALKWEQEVFGQFLSKYLAAAGRLIGGAVGELGPAALTFWLAERASYEVIYELVARTGYHYVPISAITRLVEGKDPLVKAVEAVYS